MCSCVQLRRSPGVLTNNNRHTKTNIDYTLLHLSLSSILLLLWSNVFYFSFYFHNFLRGCSTTWNCNEMCDVIDFGGGDVRFFSSCISIRFRQIYSINSELAFGACDVDRVLPNVIIQQILHQFVFVAFSLTLLLRLRWIRTNIGHTLSWWLELNSMKLRKLGWDAMNYYALYNRHWWMVSLGSRFYLTHLPCASRSNA